MTITNAKPKLRVAIVDDESLYTRRLMDEFRGSGEECIQYGPISSPPTKSRNIMETLGPNGVRVWTQNLFPLQIVRRAIKDQARIVHIQFEFYGIHSYGPLYASLGVPITMLLLRLSGVKTVITLHTVMPRGNRLRIIRETSPSSRRIPTPLLEAFLLLFSKVVSSLSNAVLVHAEVFKRRLVKQYRVDPSKVKVVPHGVDSIRNAPKGDAIQNGNQQNLILYFGVLSPRKGLEMLLTAFWLLQKRRDNCELWLAGSSPPYYHRYESKLKALATELGLASRVRFLGSVDGGFAHQLFDQARFIVLPYSYDVSASGALSWALAHGLPVIASDNEYFQEEMSHSQFGLVVSPGNCQMLADALETLLTRDDLRVSFAHNAKRMGDARSWSTVAKSTLDLYYNLLK